MRMKYSVSGNSVECLDWVYVAEVLESWGCRGGLCEQSPAAAPHQSTASSKREALLASAKPGNDAGWAFGRED